MVSLREKFDYFCNFERRAAIKRLAFGLNGKLTM